jgi:hypothetical protein
MTHKRGGKQQFAKRPLDEVEWELVRADIAHLKAEQEKSGDRAKWETDQRFLWCYRLASRERLVAPLDRFFSLRQFLGDRPEGANARGVSGDHHARRNFWRKRLGFARFDPYGTRMTPG